MIWTLDKIKEMINDGVEENIHLDYKAAGSLEKTDSKKKEIAKDVSAFANSDGGIIIYGVKEHDNSENKHLPESIDPIDGNEITKEWLEQVINSNIFPRIPGINITPIQTEDPHLNKVIYVVDIPKGDTAYQASDKRYYRRFNFLSQMMEDWEIKDIIHRQTKSNIELLFESEYPKEVIEESILKKRNQTFRFDIWAYNDGMNATRYLDCFFKGDADTAKNIVHPDIKNKDFEIIYSNDIERKIKIGNDEFVIYIDRIPILPKTSRIIGSITIKGSFIKDENILNIQISSDDNIKYIIIKGKELLDYIK